VSLAVTHQHLGRHDEARAHAEHALRLARAHSFRVVEGQALTALARPMESERDLATAADLAERAITIHHETGHRLGEARTLMALARIRRRTDSAAAELLSRRALAIFEDVGVPEGVTRS
jgi:tetratricopeptide (TPR) repeat protein